ncbi:hypothetical protein N7470_004119 [Penicillium chermesinum]|nr:hypothetical protein N7470_004119 [Penicillium chermesinum]
MHKDNKPHEQQGNQQKIREERACQEKARSVQEGQEKEAGVRNLSERHKRQVKELIEAGRFAKERGIGEEIWRAKILERQVRQATEHIEAGRLEEERLQKEREERELRAKKAEERRAKERAERVARTKKRQEEQKEEERQERERLEKESLESKQQEAERLGKEQEEKLRHERERVEEQRLEKERLEKERLEKDRLEKDRLEKGRLEKDRLEAEAQEQKAEEDREKKRKEAQKKARRDKAQLERKRLDKEIQENRRLEKQEPESGRLQQELEEKSLLDEKAKGNRARWKQKDDISRAGMPKEAPSTAADRLAHSETQANAGRSSHLASYDPTLRITQSLTADTQPEQIPGRGRCEPNPVQESTLQVTGSPQPSTPAALVQGLGCNEPDSGQTGGVRASSESDLIQVPTTEDEGFPPKPPLRRRWQDANCYKVGIVCALWVEYLAVRALFDEIHPMSPVAPADSNTYALGKMNGHNVVAACLPHSEYGTNSTAAVATNMKRSFPSVMFCLLVGIAGGVPSERNDIRLGDVVVGSQVIQYDMGKALVNGGFQRSGALQSSPIQLRTALSSLRSDPWPPHELLQRYIRSIAGRKGYKYPGLSKDRLFSSEYAHDPRKHTCDSCESAHLKLRKPRSNDRPVIHYGIIASGNKVIKDAELRDSLSEKLNDRWNENLTLGNEVLCFEMEAAGIMNILQVWSSEAYAIIRTAIRTKSFKDMQPQRPLHMRSSTQLCEYEFRHK